jgi:hypothetical protein
MLVFRECRRAEDPRLRLQHIRLALDRLAPGHAGLHDRVVELLIGLGVLESGVNDAMHPDADGTDPISGALRAASVAAGHLLWHSWRGRPAALGPWVARTRAALDIVDEETLPASIEVSVPEGYAHYGLFPESYIVAAERAAKSLGIGRAVCIGIRSIGTSLSAAVAATLEELGCEVLSLTLRPRGHPFDRYPRLAPTLESAMRDRAHNLFLLVDEGPGLSGSSFMGTARVLRELGVGEDHIVLLPSWRTEGQSLRSADARARWRRHPQVTAGFDEVWMATGRLERLAPSRVLTDVSAGAWRPLLIPDPAGYPPVQPQHERRKLLARAGGGRSRNAPDLVLRFAGLGPYGAGKLERAAALAQAGFGAAPVELTHGFLVQEFVAGTPVGRAQVTPALLQTMARYLAYLRCQFPARGESAIDLRPMMFANVAEALGEHAAASLESWAGRFGPVDAEPPTALDGRMLPHEWILTPSGYLKTDAVDHHDDHFYPGPHDIAWDVAGTCLEFDLSGSERRGFLECYRRASGDRGITDRLPCFALAYLAFRLGYATTAAETLGGSPDGRRFGAHALRYRNLLAIELRAGGAARWAA